MAPQKRATGKIRGALAPVLIPTCNRFEHFRNLVTSLEACPEAKKTHLYIALDAAFAPEVAAANQRIAGLAACLKGFGAVTVWRRDHNLGANRNIGQAVEDVFRSHDRLIFLEDDNVVARNFLAFMNQAMTAFASDPRCFSVSGYHFEPSLPSDPAVDFYRAPYFNAWGVGLFRDRFVSAASLRGRRPSPYFLHPLNLWKTRRFIPHLFRLYMESWLQEKIYGDVMYSLYCLQQNMYSVFPSATKVINRGFDGSGLHCGTLDRPFHQGFVRQEQAQFSFSIDPAADAYFQRLNRLWFSRTFAAPLRHVSSLYWRYFTRVMGWRLSSRPS